MPILQMRTLRFEENLPTAAELLGGSALPTSATSSLSRDPHSIILI